MKLTDEDIAPEAVGSGKTLPYQPYTAETLAKQGEALPVSIVHEMSRA
jgi:hypothetical protein